MRDTRYMLLSSRLFIFWVGRDHCLSLVMQKQIEGKHPESPCLYFKYIFDQVFKKHVKGICAPAISV